MVAFLINDVERWNDSQSGYSTALRARARGSDQESASAEPRGQTATPLRQVIIRRRADFAPQKRLTDVPKLHVYVSADMVAAGTAVQARDQPMEDLQDRSVPVTIR
jgi:hypothetical protein